VDALYYFYRTQHIGSKKDYDSDDNGPWNSSYWDNNDYGFDEVEHMRLVDKENRWIKTRDVLIYYAENNVIDIENAEDYENQILQLSWDDANLYLNS
jgi:transcription initiation factor IIE alpha subunit